MKVFGLLALLILILSGGGAVGADDDNTVNDRILQGDKKQFIEVFKKDTAHGDKNYIYTISEFTDKWGRNCTVVTGDSEKTIALDCAGDPLG